MSAAKYLFPSRVLTMRFTQKISGQLDCKLPIVTQVRYRKPRWMGRAPSKEGIYFKKLKPTKHDQMKAEVMYTKYNAALQSIVAAFQEELLLLDDNKQEADETEWKEKEHHKRCMMYNEEENKKMQEKRESVLIGKLEEQKQHQDLMELRAKTELDHVLRHFEREVRETIEESEDWVTLDNLEEKIVEALDNVINFNFAVDTDGVIAKRSYLS